MRTSLPDAGFVPFIPTWLLPAPRVNHRVLSGPLLILDPEGVRVLRVHRGRAALCTDAVVEDCKKAHCAANDGRTGCEFPDTCVRRWLHSLPESAARGRVYSFVTSECLRVEVYYGTDAWRGKTAVIEATAADLRLVHRIEIENADTDTDTDTDTDQDQVEDSAYANALVNIWCGMDVSNDDEAPTVRGIRVMRNLNRTLQDLTDAATWLGEYASPPRSPTAASPALISTEPNVLYVVRDDAVFAAT